MEDRLLTSNDAAKILKCGPDLIRYLHRTGKLIPVSLTQTGMRLFRLEDVERLAEERAARKDSFKSA